MPVRKGNWWRYTRTVEGQQYAIHCRRRVAEGEITPPMPEDGKPLAGEEVLLDGNELAAGAAFFSLGALSVSPDERLLAYSTDFSGDERFTLRVKDLATGSVLDDEVPDTYYGCAWSRDGSTLFYVTVDDAWRPYRVWRHVVGTPAAADVVVFEEADEKFWLGVGTSRDERFVEIHTSSKLTSEAWLLDAADPSGSFAVVAPRRYGVEYGVEVAGDRLLILHNDGAENFELAAAPLPGAPGYGDAASWTPVIAHRADTRLLSVDAFADYLVLSYRRDGLTGLSVLPASGAGPERPVTFPEPLYTVGPGSNPEYTQTRFRLGYNSHGHAGHRLRPGPGDRRPHPAEAAAGAAVPVRRRLRPGRLRAVPRVGGGRRTAPGCRSRSSAGRAPRATDPRPACCTGTAATRSRSTPASRFPGFHCLTGASCSRSRTSGAAARWADPGTTTGRC